LTGTLAIPEFADVLVTVQIVGAVAASQRNQQTCGQSESSEDSGFHGDSGQIKI
jgi:hypothetical protein